ncbi:MAG: glycosyltransferase family 9 protein [Candidatus Omnitrophica bacterium]|nr:glycosyltransferase family 9 protein [Candidatus Omnitrophota bacterium]
MQEFKKILVIRTDRIGDVVLTIPAVRALHEAFPKARITMWVAKSTSELVEGLSFVNEVIVEDTSMGWKGYWDFIKILKEKRFDLAVNYHPKRRTNSACFLAGIPVRLGYYNNKFGFFLTLPVADLRHMGKKHEAEFCLDLLRDIGVVSSDTRLELAVNAQAEAWAEQFFKSHGLVGKKLVALHPDASSSSKCWPAQMFGELGARLALSEGVVPIVVGGVSARQQLDVIGKQMDCDYHDLTGSLSMAQLVSLLRRCQLLVSNDSGPVHVSAAVGTPVISLFLRTQPGINHGRWRPLGVNSAVLLNKPGEEIVLDAECQVVGGKFDSISVDEVLAEAVRLLGSKPRAS